MRRFLRLLLLLLLMFLCCVTAFAHPGKTDKNGGHTDHDTGEYHYHHGYPAHDHYDMDGDGYFDCPYDFDDQTNHNSGKPSDDDKTNSEYVSSKQGNYNTYSYISFGVIIAFFILVNIWAIHIDRTDTSPNDEPVSLLSVFISIFSTLIVFALFFLIMFLIKQPIAWRDISFKEMLQVLFFSIILGGIVWLVVDWASLLVNTFLCKLFNAEVHGWAGSFQRLTIPLSYAFTVLLFILQ